LFIISAIRPKKNIWIDKKKSPKAKLPICWSAVTIISLTPLNTEKRKQIIEIGINVFSGLK